jgi:hypothetical protein
MSLPFGVALFQTKFPLAYPPYHPAMIQMSANYLKKDELAMSDVPAAFAWYGHRQCVWLTPGVRPDFFNIHDYIKPVTAVYLTPVTLEGAMTRIWQASTWVNFVVDPKAQVGFPLQSGAPGYIESGQFLLLDYPRWQRGRLQTDEQQPSP